MLICSNVLFEYAHQVKNLGNTLLELLSEALGLKPSHLADIECNQAQVLLCHYYPPCPQPELAIGTSRHSDGGFLTILLQDEIGGLQIFKEEQWVDVTPTPGAFIVNIGDLLQVFKSCSPTLNYLVYSTQWLVPFILNYFFYVTKMCS
jgi:isopenicillin N synthase-like dioxygenase